MRDDLELQLVEQRALIADYCELFDAGKERQSRPLATSLRVLLHQTGSSHALLEQLDIRTRISWVNTAMPIHPANLLPTWGLVSLRATAVDDVGTMSPSWMPHLNVVPWGRQTRQQFTRWWQSPVALDGKKRRWTREELVLAVANKDGGAHVDMKLPADYSALSRDNAFGGVVFGNGIESPAPDPVPACIRQIAFEVMESLDGWPK